VEGGAGQFLHDLRSEHHLRLRQESQWHLPLQSPRRRLPGSDSGQEDLAAQQRALPAEHGGQER